MDIDEEIIDIKPTGYITINRKGKIKIFDSLLDFVAITKSDTIIIFEFKKGILRSEDFKQAYNYYKQVYCKEKKEYTNHNDCHI